MWIDTHCHLAWKDYDDDRAAVLQRAAEAGVEGFVVIGAGSEEWGNEKAVRLVEQIPNAWAAVGIHPHDAAKVNTDGAVEQLRELSKHPKVVAIGEIGLDYHYDNSPRDSQQKVFRALIHLAHEANLPIAIHSREAWADTLSLLKEEGPQPKKGVFHCFGEGVKEAQAALELGFYISIPGIVTFKKSGNLIPVIETIPLERILVETDSPFLAPVPFRGKRNEPAFVKFVGEKIAEIKKLSVEEVARVTTENARRLFDLSLRGMQ